MRAKRIIQLLFTIVATFAMGAEARAECASVLGRLTPDIRSSLGLHQRVAHNGMGDVLGVRVDAAPNQTPDTQPWENIFQRDALGLEIARYLPGGLISRWTRDRAGKPIQHDVWAGERVYRRRQYKWGFADRLQQVHEAGVGPTQYGHDGLGQLAWAQYPDGSADLRMPDAVGNLFRAQDRSDRKYGPAGQLLEMRTDEGITTYDYDSAGNLIKKQTPRGTWIYRWNGAGRLEQVERPDGDIVRFAYDALGRRISKTFRGETTYWIWDGNNPLHEWRVADPKAPPAPPAPEGAKEAASTRRDAEQSANPSTGPPANPVPDDLITWLFDPNSFAPMAKLVGQDRYAIITDHLGSPIAMADESGNRVWAAEYNPYGQLRAWLGDRQACPFRFPGQYEDAETGLYYNRFRYYDPAAGQYTAQDPIGLAGGLRLYEYAADVLISGDPLGLSKRPSYDEERLYRYVSEGEAEVIRRTGKIPNVDRSGNPKDVFLTPRRYQTAGRAKTHNQLPERPSYRVEVDPQEVPNRTPIRRVEPSDNPQWGRGGGLETTTPDEIRVDPDTLVKLKGAP